MDGAEAQTDRVIRLLRYLREFVSLRTKVVRRVDDYARDGLVLWFSKMPREGGCRSPLWTEFGEGKEGTWLEVRRQDLPRHPQLPESLAPWTDVEKIGRSDLGEPEIRSVAYLPTGSSDPDDGDPENPTLEPHDLEDHPEVYRSWNDYLEKWRPWQEEHSRKAKIQDLYGELFHAYQTQRRLGEAYELVFGLGLVSWTNPQGHSVRRHFVTAQAELKFDQVRGVITVECPPPPDGARLQLEDEFIEATERPAPEYYETASAALSQIGDAIWDRQLMDPMLKQWAHAFHADTVYSGELEPLRDSAPLRRFVLRRPLSSGSEPREVLWRSTTKSSGR